MPLLEPGQVVIMTTMTRTESTALRLAIPRVDAARELRAAIKIGTAIKNQRLRDMHDLDDARSEKSEWVSRSSEMLQRLFTSAALTDEFNLFTPTILPEYAEFSMFADSFRDEMKQRLAKVQHIVDVLNEIPERVRVIADALADPAAPVMMALEPVSAPPTVSAAPAVQPPAALPPPVPRATAAPVRDAVVSPPPMPVSGAAKQTVVQAVVEHVAPAISPAPTPAAPPSLPTPAPAPMAEEVTPQNTAPTAGVTRSEESLASRATVLVVSLDDGSEAAAASGLLRRLALPFVTGGSASSVPQLLDSNPHTDFVLVCGSTPDPVSDAFAIGCCVGRLGAGKVCLLRSSRELSELFGVSHVEVGTGTESWHLTLARHLRRGGVDVDLNQLC